MDVGFFVADQPVEGVVALLEDPGDPIGGTPVLETTNSYDPATG